MATPSQNVPAIDTPAEKSQMEGPATYAPHEDEPASKRAAGAAQMTETPKVSAKTNSGLLDDHDPNDIAQKQEKQKPQWKNTKAALSPKRG
jgi:hypothetical protein